MNRRKFLKKTITSVAVAAVAPSALVETSSAKAVAWLPVPAIDITCAYADPNVLLIAIRRYHAYMDHQLMYSKTDFTL